MTGRLVDDVASGYRPSVQGITQGDVGVDHRDTEGYGIPAAEGYHPPKPPGAGGASERDCWHVIEAQRRGDSQIVVREPA